VDPPLSEWVYSPGRRHRSDRLLDSQFDAASACTSTSRHPQTSASTYIDRVIVDVADTHTGVTDQSQHACTPLYQYHTDDH